MLLHALALLIRWRINGCWETQYERNKAAPLGLKFLVEQLSPGGVGGGCFSFQR